MEHLFKVILENCTPADLVLFCVFLWLRTDVEKINKALHNGIIAKVSTLVSDINHLDNSFSEFKNQMRDNCLEYRSSLERQIDKIQE